MTYGSRDWIESQYAGSKGDPWGLDWRPSQKFRYARMIEALRGTIASVPRPVSIIDMGCATGAFTAMLAGMVGNGDGRGSLLGVDIAQSAVERAASRFPNIRFERMAIEECAAKYAGSADLVTCMEVLYYLPKDQRPAAVRNLRELLKPGGLVLVSSMIANAPYFSLAELEALLAADLEVVETGVLHLKPIVLWEKLQMKLRSADNGNRSEAYDPVKIDRWNRWSKAVFGRYASSHGYVIARRA